MAGCGVGATVGAFALGVLLGGPFGGAYAVRHTSGGTAGYAPQRPPAAEGEQPSPTRSLPVPSELPNTAYWYRSSSCCRQRLLSAVWGGVSAYARSLFGVSPLVPTGPRRQAPADGTAGTGGPDPAHGRTRKSLVHYDLVLLLWEPLEAGVAVHGGEAGVCRPAALPFWLYHL